ncbi:MAG: protein-disulfide reductase DsbD family protein [Candidatus Zipacnadales bacterium]
MENGRLVAKIVKTTVALVALLVIIGQVAGAQGEISDRNGFASVIGERGLIGGLLLAFGAGVLTSFTPCVYPMIPITIGIIGARRESTTISRSFGLAFTYVMGLALVYSVLGLLVGLIGPQVRTWLMSSWILGAVAVIFVLLALGMFGLYELQLPSSVAAKLHTIGGQGIIGVLLMGMVSGLVASPCTAAPLAGILTVIAVQGDPLSGFAFLFSFAWGMGLLLLMVGGFSGLLNRLPKSGAWMMDVRYLFGFVFLAAAAYFARTLLPDLAYRLILAGCLIGGGVVFGALDSLPPNPGGGLRTKRGLAVLILVLGFYMLLGTLWTRGLLLPHSPESPALLAEVSPKQPGGGAPTGALAREIAWQTDIDVAFEIAAREAKPIFMDWTADWCSICQEVERNAFSRTDVRQALATYVPLRIDATELNEQEQELAEKYGYLAPPMFAIVTPTGDLIAKQEGYERVDELLAFLNAPASGANSAAPGGT